MKRVISVCFAAAMLIASFSGCDKTAEKAKSKTESAASAIASNTRSDMDNIGEGITEAVSAVVSEADRMYDNGVISDGDGVIGNEDEDSQTDETTDITDDNE